MPIYQYECKSCKHTVDVLQKFSDEHLKFCPQCQKPDFERLISVGNFHLKGRGWFKTGYSKR
jgi:putative FmdB family regulatory protein